MKMGIVDKKGRLLTTAAGGFALALAMVGPAFAQTAPASTATQETAEEEEIIITGFRASLRNSTETKRNSDAIVEAVSAEEIGKLPDNSIAESLARLPGLSAQRLFGRAQQISVRGLSPDFTTALLNGREQVSAGDNRGVEFDQYPSELLSSVVVYKTPTASLIGQGLAGTADLRTVRPLAYDERVLALNARYEWNDIGALVQGGEEDGYRATASYIDQSADRRWGWAIGLTTTSSPTQAERFEAWGYPTTGTGAFVIGGSKPYVQSSVLERDAVMGVLEFRPTNSFSTRIDTFYSEFEEVQDLKGIELPLFWSAAQLVNPVVQGGLVTSGTFTGVEGVIRNDVRRRNSWLQAFGWNATWDINDHWTMEADFSHSQVRRKDLDLETYAGTGPGSGVGAADSLGFRRGNGAFVFSPTLNYADYSLMRLTDPQGWGQAGFIKQPRTDDELNALRLSFERALDNGPFSSIEFGFNMSSRDKTKTSDEAFVDLIGGNNQTVAIPTAFRQGSTPLTFIGIPGMVTYDPQALLRSGNVYQLRQLLNSDVIVKSWGVSEDVSVFYTQLNVDSALHNMPLTGNLGLQVVKTDQASNGGVQTATGPQLANAGDSFTEVLPSVNLSLGVMENTQLRLGIARTLARPRMDDLRASFAITYNLANLNSPNPSASYWGGNGGNPYLRPWIANSVDLSLEHYIGDGGYFALAAFYKDLESYIYTQNVLFDFTGFPTQNLGDRPATRLGSASIPVNGEGGYIQGLEFTASVPAEVFVPALEGFGLVFNASTTDSSIEVPGNPASALPGLSETVVNTTVYYERAGFEARVSNRYRSDFLGEVTGFGAGRELRTVQGESILDAQIGYRFEQGPLEGLAVQFQANNINDEPFVTYVDGDERRVRDYQRYGTTYLFGVSYRR